MKAAPEAKTKPANPLLSPLTALRGAGPALAQKLQRLNLHSVQDLAFFLPLRYEDRTRQIAIGALRPGQRAAIEGTIELSEIAFRGRRVLLCSVSDGTGLLTLRFFHFSRAQAAGLERGRRVRCFGEVRNGPASLEMIHPEYQLLADDARPAYEQSLTPVYPATEGVSQGRLRNLSRQVLEMLQEQPPEELLPADVVAELDLLEIGAAVQEVHRPHADTPLPLLLSGQHPAQRRLAFEEILAHHLSLRRLRARLKLESGVALNGSRALVGRFIDGLPFTLTEAQNRVLDEVLRDLALDTPMLRLVQGDVGSGKTVVAAAAALAAVEEGYQCAVMAPTELLAEQHLQNFQAWMTPLGIHTAWLSGSVKSKARAQTLAAIKSGEANIIVGTHALFQESVEFRSLAFVIVDEQHRFGVHQRLALREKGLGGNELPHQLIMTATPIPRTLAMTAYADLDSSVIDELPPGRTPVVTVALPDKRRAEVVARVRKACLENRQAYWVCPLIEESEILDYEAAEETHAKLVEALPELEVGLIHGRMSARDKDRAMLAFKDGRTQVLVATTVIEVGVDVPNASLMIVENAERMGLAQLHQLRGRVGRGAAKSTCLLLYRAPLSGLARTRLAVLRNTNNGFEVARQDLKLRGPGEVLGTRQTGVMQMRVADLLRDADLLPAVQKTAEELLTRHPQRIDALLARWIGTAARFGSV